MNSSNTNNLTKEQKEEFLEKALDGLYQYVKAMNLSLEYMNNQIQKLSELNADINNDNILNNSDNSKIS